MELRHFRYFVAVAEAENVSRAALKLHVSQPGISRQIHDLEDEIGFQLFERGAKSLKLTDAGRKFLDEARAVLQRADEAVKNARALAGGTRGEIRVGYAPSLTVQILPRTLRVFQAKYPNVRVVLRDLSTEEMLSQLRAGRLELALTVRMPRPMLRGLHFEELARYAMRVAVAPGHPLAGKKSVTLAQVAREPLIAYTRDEYPEYHESVGKIFSDSGLKWKIAEEHDGVTSIIAAVEAGRGFALVPECVACMVGPRLKLIPLAVAIPEIPVGMVWRAGDIPAIVEQFIAAARVKEPA